MYWEKREPKTDSDPTSRIPLNGSHLPYKGLGGGR